MIRHVETVIKLKDVFDQPNHVEKAVQYMPPAKEKTKEKEKPALEAEKKSKPKAEEPEDEADELLVPAEPSKNPTQ